MAGPPVRELPSCPSDKPPSVLGSRERVLALLQPPSASEGSGAGLGGTFGGQFPPFPLDSLLRCGIQHK